MIECQYCYTKNNGKAPSCQACGGPLVEQEEIKEEIIMCPDPLNPGEFVHVGTTRPGVTCDEFVDSIRRMMRMW